MSDPRHNRETTPDKQDANLRVLPDLTIAERKSAAFLDGNDAALRVGRYQGATDIPPCEHAPGTLEFESWWEGFDFGTENLIHPPELADLDPDS